VFARARRCCCAAQAVAAAVGEGVFQQSKTAPWTANIVVRPPALRAAAPVLVCRLQRSRAHALALTRCRRPQEGVLKRLASLNKPLKYVGASPRPALPLRLLCACTFVWACVC
jgi:hypothetical protein